MQFLQQQQLLLRSTKFIHFQLIHQTLATFSLTQMFWGIGFSKDILFPWLLSYSSVLALCILMIRLDANDEIYGQS